MFAAVYSMIVAVEVQNFSLEVWLMVALEIWKCMPTLLFTCLRNGYLPRPTWSYCDSTDRICKCTHIPTRALQCDGFDKGNALHILVSNCVTYNEELDLTEVGLCIYNFIHDNEFMVNEVYYLLPPNTSDWNDDMCGRFNMTATLCSRCNAEDGFYPRAYLFDVTCIHCTNGKSNWWKYVLSAYLPLTFSYFVILCFNPLFTSSRIYHLQPNLCMATFYSINIFNQR